MLMEDESAHDVCSSTFREIGLPVFTCWPVVSEVVWLLRSRQRMLNGFFRAFEVGALKLLPLGAGDLPPILRILEKYADLRPDLADACLVHLAEREGIDTIFTLDRRDFSVYRTTKRKGFRLLPAE